ncbi:hypothetical protein A4X13_0g9625 [Tilletia indica]|uniref:Uncharacterized protein n=1 Tax=Tilletia indica TaxID=43049 RepID=A0A8T8S8F4_9BASI|nr:hypothetical protein A4X13_0g9625 [Tilletia indica]
MDAIIKFGASFFGAGAGAAAEPAGPPEAPSMPIVAIRVARVLLDAAEEYYLARRAAEGAPAPAMKIAVRPVIAATPASPVRAPVPPMPAPAAPPAEAPQQAARRERPAGDGDDERIARFGNQEVNFKTMELLCVRALTALTAVRIHHITLPAISAWLAQEGFDVEPRQIRNALFLSDLIMYTNNLGWALV